ncbi:hypothetical protein [Amycolatopsis sp. cmx-8-4]|uniref:hypothetical protein n=1 Tax=Amycolatopsis sp. cmx-8-4 TaxID=2790947 RepID=UPI0039785F02
MQDGRVTGLPPRRQAVDKTVLPDSGPPGLVPGGSAFTATIDVGYFDQGTGTWNVQDCAPDTEPRR